MLKFTEKCTNQTEISFDDLKLGETFLWIDDKLAYNYFPRRLGMKILCPDNTFAILDLSDIYVGEVCDDINNYKIIKIVDLIVTEEIDKSTC